MYVTGRPGFGATASILSMRSSNDSSLVVRPADMAGETRSVLIVFPSDFQVYRAAYCTILERLLRISSGKWCGRYVMPLSKEVRRLERAWQNETAWPKRLDWIEIDNIRGWQGQRIKFPGDLKPVPEMAGARQLWASPSNIVSLGALIHSAKHSMGSDRAHASVNQLIFQTETLPGRLDCYQTRVRPQ